MNLSASVSHPNRTWFEGVLTYLDETSQGAPHGADKHRIRIKSGAAREALNSLLGMPVNLTTEVRGSKHDKKTKCGIITDAWIDRSRVMIEGFIYQQDFPEVIMRLRNHGHDYGFSFDSTEGHVTDRSQDVWEIYSLIFTGATLMLKEKAAYKNTSIRLKEDWIAN